METKVQRLKDWLASFIRNTPVEPDRPVITKIQGTNKECFDFEAFTIESEVYTDRLIISVYQNGRRVLKGWVFHTSEGTFALDHSISFHPNYKLRNHIRTYAEARLKELAAQLNKD